MVLWSAREKHLLGRYARILLSRSRVAVPQKLRIQFVLSSTMPNMPAISMRTWVGVKPQILRTGTELLSRLLAIPYRLEPPGAASITFLQPFTCTLSRLWWTIASLWLRRADNDCCRDDLKALLSNQHSSLYPGLSSLFERNGRILRLQTVAYFRPTVSATVRCDSN